MKTVALPAALALVSALALGCGGAPAEPPATPAAPEASPTPAASSAPEAAAPAASAEPQDEADARAAADAAEKQAGNEKATAEEPESMTLARELVKTGGRRIGWSAKKKGFVIPSMKRNGDTASLDIVFTDAEGSQKDVMRVCQFGECEEHLKEKAQALLPKLAERLAADEYVSIRATGWPGSDELDLPTLGLKLRLVKGKLEAQHEKKPAKTLGTVKPPKLLAIYLVPDDKRVGLFSSEDGQEENAVFSVVKLP